jgi:hypothetical protein
MPKIVVTTIVIETKKAPAAENAGRLRAATHTKTGNSQVIGNTVSQSTRGSEMISPVTNARARSPNVPSMTSLRGDGRRTTSVRPITSGAASSTQAAASPQPRSAFTFACGPHAHYDRGGSLSFHPRCEATVSGIGGAVTYRLMRGLRANSRPSPCSSRMRQ